LHLANRVGDGETNLGSSLKLTEGFFTTGRINRMERRFTP
jgi:hypothetical protein